MVCSTRSGIYSFKQEDKYSFLSNLPVKINLFKSMLTVSGMTGLSRVFGLIRDVIIASFFGAGLGVDAFIVAFRIPNFLRRLFAEGGFSQAFVPVISEYKERRTHNDVQALVDQTSATLALVLSVTTVAGVLAAPVLVMLFAPGFIGDADKQALTTAMLRITFPYIFFISLTALAGGVLNTYRRFAVPAFTPVLLNLSLIACAIWLAPEFTQPVVALAWGVFIAGVVQLLFQFPFLLRLRLFPRPGLNRDREGVRRIFGLLVPTLFAISITQINLLVDTLIASFLVTGSISWLYFSDRLVEFPLGVFGIALATVILPSLSGEYAKGSQASYRKTLDWALRWVVLIALPAAFGLALLAPAMLATIFQYQAFTAHDVRMAGLSLEGYAVGLPAFILIKVLATGFFSRQDTRTPVKIGVIAMFSNIFLNLLLVVPLAHAGLALATSLAAYVNAGLLYIYLRKQQYYLAEPGWGRYLTKAGIAVAAMSLMLYTLLPGIDSWLAWDLFSRVGRLLLWIGAGASVYFSVVWLTGIRPREMTAHP
ncbi:MAG: murein biosynthesis integral membrane protein MurJ [Gammaproteobacteria bacterium]